MSGQDNIVPITSVARTAAEKFGAEHDRELLTILFTDLVDSTKLQQEAGNVEAARLTELHREIVRDELAKYDAREIEWAGDSCLAVFTKPSDAVVFALRMQAEHRRVRAGEPKLPTVRIGMHLGEIVVKKRHDGGKKTEDLFGLQVSEAARVMSVARGNQIFCTRAVFDNARTALKGRPIEGVGEAAWVAYGAYLLKGSEEPVELCEVGSADVAVLKAPETNEKVSPVLPGGVEAMRALIPYDERRETTKPRPSIWRTLAGTVAGIAIGALAVTYFMRGAEPAAGPEARETTSPEIELIPEVEKRLTRTSLVLQAHQPIVPTQLREQHIQVSPDGERVAYVADVGGTNRIVIREIDRREATELPGTDGAVGIFFSPDGASIGFWTADGLYYTSVFGGGVHRIVSTSIVFGAAWLDDQSIVFGGLHPLQRVSLAGGEITALTEFDASQGEVFHHSPWPLPGGRRLLYFRGTRSGSNNRTIALHNLDTGESKNLLEGGMFPRYASTGHIVFSREGALMAVPFDLDTEEVTGLPLPVTEPGMSDSVTVIRNYAFSSKGDLFYAPSGGPRSRDRRLVWVDRQGETEYLNLPPMPYESIRISPDGTRIAFDFGVTSDVWIYDLRTEAPMRALTAGGATENFPEWSPDGQRVAYEGTVEGGWDLFSRAADGSGSPVRLTFDTALKTPTDWVSGGDEILFQVLGPTSNLDLKAYSFAEPDDPRLVQGSEHNEVDGTVSRDGKWFAYSSTEFGRFQVMVKSYPAMEGGWKVSGDSSIAPVWSQTSDELFYLGEKGAMVVRYEGDQAFRIVSEEVIFDFEEISIDGRLYVRNAAPRSYDVSPLDGRILLILEPPQEEPTSGLEIAMVTNWFEVLRSIGSTEISSR